MRFIAAQFCDIYRTKGDKVMEERELKIHGIYRHFKNKYYIVEDREPVAKRTNSRGEFVGESRS